MTKIAIQALTAFATMTFLLPTSAQTELKNSAEFKPILGIVYPNITTMSDLKTALTDKGCAFEVRRTDIESLTVKDGCFDLPGHPAVGTTDWNPDSPKEPLTGFSIVFPLFQLLPVDIAEKYLLKLEQNYGKPSFVLNSPNSTQYIWGWPARNFMIEFLVGKTASVGGAIYYSMGSTATENWIRYSKKKESVVA